MRAVRGCLSAAVLMVGLAACGDDGSNRAAEVAEIAVVAYDYRFDVPARYEVGWSRCR